MQVHAALPSGEVLKEERRPSFGNNMRRLSRNFTKQLAAARSQYATFANVALYFGAGLSIVDMLCDFAMVREYLHMNQKGYATATIVTLLLSLLGQVTGESCEGGLGGTNRYVSRRSRINKHEGETSNPTQSSRSLRPNVRLSCPHPKR
jgi:hypothetical protein